MKKYIPIIIIVLILGLGVFGIILMNQAKEEENKYNDSKRLIELSGEEFMSKINNKDSFILLIVKTGCIYCEEFKPIIKGVLEEYEITAYSLNTANLSEEENNFLKDIANVSSTPTTLFINNGEETTTLNRLVGKVTKSRIINRFKDLGYIE